LINLAGNALKFTRQGRVELGVERRGDVLVYRVADTGIGIAPDKIADLFTEFTQGDATITKEFGGTGLGLSITRRFVELHKGRIWVESEVGRGSTFFIAIPLRLDGATTP
jgi:signal transduction histidine kinase